jgi:hypothetical protein
MFKMRELAIYFVGAVSIAIMIAVGYYCCKQLLRLCLLLWRLSHTPKCKQYRRLGFTDGSNHSLPPSNYTDVFLGFEKTHYLKDNDFDVIDDTLEISSDFSSEPIIQPPKLRRIEFSDRQKLMFGDPAEN